MQVLAQTPDIIVINGEDFLLLCEPLECYLREQKIQLPPKSTSCLRGYTCKWKLKESGLYLTHLEGNMKKDTSDLEYLFPNTSSIKATWYSGKLRIPVGKMVHYVHEKYNSVFTEELELYIEHGSLKKICHKKNFFTALNAISSVDIRKISFEQMLLFSKKWKAILLLEQGAQKEEARDYAGALSYYNKAISLNATAEAYLLRAGLYHLFGDDNAVLENLNKSISIDKDYSHAYINRALYYRHHKNYKQAQQDYDQAIKLSPSSFEIVLFNQEDVFRYGKFLHVWQPDDSFLVFNLFDGHLFLDICLKTDKKGKADTCICVNAESRNYFFFRKIYNKPIYNNRIVRVEFILAKLMFYLMTYVFRKKVKPIELTKDIHLLQTNIYNRVREEDLSLPKELSFNKNIPLQLNTNQFIYIESRYNKPLNEYLSKEFESINNRFSEQGYSFIYFPAILQSIISHSMELINNSFPLMNSDFFVIKKEVYAKYLKKNFYPYIETINLDGGLLRYIETRGYEHIFEYYQFKNPNPLVVEAQIDICLKPSEKITKPTFEEYSFTHPVTTAIKKINEQMEVLKQSGVNLKILEPSIFQREENVKLSRLLINKHYRIFLVDCGGAEIVMRPLPKAVFFLFLKHTEGIQFKHLSDYINELIEIYKKISGRENLDDMVKSIYDIVDPTKNAINEKCSRIREAFLNEIDETMAQNYFITGERGGVKKIVMNRKLLILEGNI